jgi:hypothetical protein
MQLSVTGQSGAIRRLIACACLLRARTSHPKTSRGADRQRGGCHAHYSFRHEFSFIQIVD